MMAKRYWYKVINHGTGHGGPWTTYLRLTKQKAKEFQAQYTVIKEVPANRREVDVE